MKKQRFEKVVESDMDGIVVLFYSFGVGVLLIILLKYLDFISEFWKGVFATLLVLGIISIWTCYFIERKVYWRKVK